MKRKPMAILILNSQADKVDIRNVSQYWAYYGLNDFFSEYIFPTLEI